MEIMAKTKDVIDHIPEEDQDFYSDDDLFSISSWGADLSFRELIARYDDDELLKPELQRKYVWDKAEASRFIESLLLGLPVPSIFLAKAEEEKMLIVDGYQRIMTVYDFVNGIFSGDGKAFKLSKSEKLNKRWRGKTFLELSDIEQRRIRNTTIHAIIFVQDSPSDDNTSLFQVFERINTSGKSLQAQEIRNCIYQGDFNDLLFDLNKGVYWRALYGAREEDSRMRDMEYILRFFALMPKIIKKEKKERLSLKKHLNKYMGANKTMGTTKKTKHKNKFETTIHQVYQIWGDVAFHNISPTNPDKLVKKFSPTIFDSITIATSVAHSQGHSLKIKNAEKKRVKLLQDEDYRFAITQETMSKKSINTRVTKALDILYGL